MFCTFGYNDVYLLVMTNSLRTGTSPYLVGESLNFIGNSPQLCQITRGSIGDSPDALWDFWENDPTHSICIVTIWCGSTSRMRPAISIHRQKWGFNMIQGRNVFFFVGLSENRLPLNPCWSFSSISNAANWEDHDDQKTNNFQDDWSSIYLKKDYSNRLG